MSLVAVALAGCGGATSSPRDQVTAYVEDANAVQQEYAPAFEEANLAYRDFASQALGGREAVRELAAARGAVTEARAAVAELEAPAEARVLHSRLVRLFDMNVEFADQTALLAEYQTASARALGGLGEADRRLRRDLRGEPDPDRQAAALARYARGVSRSIERLEGLDVPQVLGPSHADQVRSLSRTRRLATELEAALRAQDAEDVARLLKAFRTRGKPSRARKLLARQAIRGYNRRYKQLSDAYADVSRAHAELERSLD